MSPRLIRIWMIVMIFLCSGGSVVHLFMGNWRYVLLGPVLVVLTLWVGRVWLRKSETEEEGVDD